MGIEAIVELFVNNGVSIAVLVYFCVRDWKFMQTLTETLTTLKEVTKHSAEAVESVEKLILQEKGE